MNKRERQFHLISRLQNAGFSYDEATTLRRIEMTLQKWSEHECNGNIQRDGDDSDGRPRWYYETARGEIIKGSLVADRERGALKRLAKLMESHPEYIAYHQSDPRGCALYLVAKRDLEDNERDLPIESYYTRGISVCE